MTRLPSVSELLVATNQTNRNENNRCSRSDQPLRTEYVQPTQQQAYYFTSPQAQPMYYSTCFAEHVPHYVCPLPHLHSTAQPMPPSFSHNMQNNYFGAPTWNAAESKAFSERSLRSDEVRFTPPNFLDTNNSNPSPDVNNYLQYQHALNHSHDVRHISMISPLAPSTQREVQAQQNRCPPLYQVQVLVNPQQLPYIMADANMTLNNKRHIIRLRTRTGCITCKKRHLKCDEAKPQCINCIRSKKVCLGYNKEPSKNATKANGGRNLVRNIDNASKKRNRSHLVDS